MRLLRRFLRWPWLRRHDAALAEELESHRQLLQTDLEAQGLSASDAMAASRRLMGNTTLAREDARQVWIAAAFDRLWRDVRYGLRRLVRETTFSFVAIGTLAAGVALTTAVFSVADAELWRPLPFHDPDRLVAIYSQPAARAASVGLSGADILDWRATAPALESLAIEGSSGRRVLRLDRAESVQTARVSAGFFSTLGRPALVGRTLDARDLHGSTAALVTDRAWRRLFASDPAVIGRGFLLDAESIEIVGVVAADDSLGPEPDFFLAFDEQSPPFLDRGATATYRAIARLAPGATAAIAREQVQSVNDRLAASFPDGRRGHLITVEPLDEFGDGSWRPLYFFLGASLIVLLMSTVNVAGLVAARGLRRTREFALRGALGGGTRVIAGQLLVEGALVSAAGGALGLLLAMWIVPAISAGIPADFLLRGTRIPVDFRAGAFALGVTTLTTLVFGLTPLFRTRRLDLSSTLGAGVRSGRSDHERRGRHVLLLAQIALTVVLMSAAALFLKSHVLLVRQPLGFVPSGAWAVRASLSGPRYASDDQVRGYAEALVASIRALPGVNAAAVGTSAPLGSGPIVLFAPPDRPRPAPGEEPRAILRSVGPDYFRALGIALPRGRAFTDDDVAGAPRVAVVNEYLVRRVFGDADPIGQTIDLLPGARAAWTRRPGPVTIVGVAANIKELGLNEVSFQDIYLPFAQAPSTAIELVARTDAGAAVSEPLKRAAAAIDPSMPITSVRSFDARLASAVQGERFYLMLVATFAAIAILLAGIGVYGAFAYAVQARTREFGVRLALGARPSQLVAGSLGRSVRLGLSGAIAGVLVTLAIARALGDALYLVPGQHNGLLFGVTTTDPIVLASAGVAAVLLALAAGLIPARRAARVDPAITLRAE